MQCQMSLSKKLTAKGTLQQVFYLSEAPYPPMNPYSPSPLHTVYVYTEPEFLNVFGAQESIPMNQFRQTM